MDEKLEFFKSINFSEENVNTMINDVRIGVYIDDIMINNFYGQIMLEVTINLLSRIYSRIVISVPDGEYNIQYCNKVVNIKEYILNISKDSRLNGQDSIQFSDDLGCCKIILCIGKLINKYLNINKIFISANGWLAGLSQESIELGNNMDRNPTGAIAASCMGVAEILKITIDGATSKQIIIMKDKIIFSTYDYKVNSTSPQNPKVNKLNISNVVLFGVGSVGSSILYAMKFLREVYGTLHIVDTDKEIESRNLLRYAYLNASDINSFKGKDKVSWAKEKMKCDCPLLEIIPYNMSVKEYTNVRGAYDKITLAVSAVDNILARRDITDLLAKRNINAGTGDTRFTITRSGFNDGFACLYCNYQNINNPPANNYQQYSQMTGLPVERIYNLMDENDTLSENDFSIMVKRGIVNNDMKEKVIGKPLQSFIHERFYGQVLTSQGGNNKVITLAFVTAMAGNLLFAEMIKELSNMKNSWVGTMYEQDMFALPNEMMQIRKPNEQGFCLCQNSFRRMVYAAKYKENI